MKRDKKEAQFEIVLDIRKLEICEHNKDISGYLADMLSKTEFDDAKQEIKNCKIEIIDTEDRLIKIVRGRNEIAIKRDLRNYIKKQIEHYNRAQIIIVEDDDLLN
jgi:hypothetical protein